MRQVPAVMCRATPVLAALALAGCGASGEDTPDAKATEVPRSVAAAPMATGAVESEFGTPVKDRVATLGLLNKRNNLIQDVVLKSAMSSCALPLASAACRGNARWKPVPSCRFSWKNAPRSANR